MPETRGAVLKPVPSGYAQPAARLTVLALALAVALAGVGHGGDPTGAAPGSDVVIEAAAPAQQPPIQGSAAPASASSDWLARLNTLRGAAGLPPVVESPEWSLGCLRHAEYLVRNQTYGHTQSPDNPWYTPEGAACGQAGNVITGRSASSVPAYPPHAMVDAWMTAPFHALGMVHPGLHTVAFGQFDAANDGQRYWAAALDIIRGLAPAQQTQYPVMWPADGAAVSLTRYAGNEFPDPLASCPGYAGEAGLPILLLTGTGHAAPQVVTSQVLQNGEPVEHCAFSETSYVNPDPGAQHLARQLLGFQDAVVIIPRRPLQPGSSVSVNVALTTGSYAWSFDVQ